MREFHDIDAIKWNNGSIRWLDQTKLPDQEVWMESRDITQIAEAIKRLEVRGAPQIGVVAAFGIAITANEKHRDISEKYEQIKRTANILGKTRPTAVNLFWSINRMVECADRLLGSNVTERDFAAAMVREALAIQREDVEANRAMGKYGSALFKDGDVILSHCNAGSLATSGFGTSIGCIRQAWIEGKDVRVIQTHTAPLYQGARLSMYEFVHDGIPAKLITDNMVAYAMMFEHVSKVIVGADRVLADGTVFNKIGTYGIAVMAKYHDIPFYVAAPTSTIDMKRTFADVKDGSVIEKRSPEEVKVLLGKFRVAMEKAEALNPAFDMTPPELVSGIVTERGVLKPPYRQSIADMMRRLANK